MLSLEVLLLDLSPQISYFLFALFQYFIIFHFCFQIKVHLIYCLTHILKSKSPLPILVFLIPSLQLFKPLVLLASLYDF